MRLLIRTLAHPPIAGGFGIVLITMASQGVVYSPLFPLVVIVGISIVALLERIAPYESEWNRDDHGDTRVNALHLQVSEDADLEARKQIPSSTGRFAPPPQGSPANDSNWPIWAIRLLARTDQFQWHG
jgi:hypothetical protein